MSHALAKYIPTTASRVAIIKDGQQKWIPIEELTEEDQVDTDSQGRPLTMLAPPGRPKRPARLAASADIEDTMLARQYSISADPLYSAIAQDPSSDTSLTQTLLAMAEIQAALKFERKEAERKGVDSAQLSTIANRQMAALSKISDTVLRMKSKGGTNSIDMEGNHFKVVFTSFISLFRSALTEMDSGDDFISTALFIISRKMEEGWVDQLKSKLDNLDLDDDLSTFDPFADEDDE